MRHPPLLIAVVWTAASFAVAPASPVAAQVVTDLTYDLAALSEPQLLADWAATGTGVRAGIRVTTSGDTRFYTNSSLGLDNGVAFLMDMVASGQPLFVDGELGARMWVGFRDATMPPFLYRHVEARFVRVAGTYQVQFFNGPASLSPLGGLPQDWTGATPRIRVRIRHQEVAGVSTLFFAAENSALWAPDLSGPLTPDATNTLSLPVNDLLFPPSPGSGEFGFGNFAPGAYYADYETVRLIRSSEPDTVLPAALAVNIPTLGFPGAALFAMLVAIGGWILVNRLRS